MPFRWTVNPYRGCSHACVYCLAAHTRVLLPDGRTRTIAELRVGDAVVGTQVVNGQRRYVRTTVLAHWSTDKPAHRVRLAGGTELVASGEHRFLAERGWRHVAPGWCRSGRRPHLRRGTGLLGPGPFAAAVGVRLSHPPAYRQGYLCGLVRGDARPDPMPDRAFPSVHLELEALGRAHHFLSEPARLPALAGVGSGVGFGGAVAASEPGRIPPPRGRGGTRAGLQGSIARIADVTCWPDHAGHDWNAGFLAGLVDACGEVSGGELAVDHADGQVLAKAAEALHRLGFRFRVEPVRPGPEQARGHGHEHRHGRTLRLLGGAGALLRFLQVADPAVSARRGIDGAPVQVAGELRVEAVESLGVTLPMYDITTGTGDFVAEGVVSHNCFARNSHTYLDLDAGADFDSQIIVKVNVARVLERELRSPRWEREPVAMGTNTDPYQRAEGRYRLMPGIIGALARWGTPFSVLTKGTVLSRDVPVLASAAADVDVSLGVSVALVDRVLQSRLEPGTPSPAARLDLVRRITDAGLPCGVMVAPVLPLLTDSAEALDALLGRVRAAGASRATVLALHLRPGTREWFAAWLAREHPRLVEPYRRLYRRGSYVDPDYRRALGERVAPLLRRHGLDGAGSAVRGPERPAPQVPALPTAEQLTLL